MITLLEAKNITKRFGGLTALSDVSLTIRKGEVYGLIGPNGAGKTTFFNVLTGAYTAEEGEIVFGGVGSGLYGMLVFAIIGIFWWALHSGQFDNVEREGERILRGD